MNFLEYTNIVLQAVNEVPLTEQQLQNARGLHQFVKDSVNRAYFEIAGEWKWDWLHSSDNTLGNLQLTGERTLTPELWTAIPVTDPYKDSIEWSSIYYRSPAGDKFSLELVGWEQYENSQDFYDGIGYPRYVIQSADGRSMGIPGLPVEDVGVVYFKIWTRPSRFQFAMDTIPLPDQDYQVLIDGTLQHVWSFRGDVEQAQLSGQRFEHGLRKMKQKYSNQTLRMRWL